MMHIVFRLSIAIYLSMLFASKGHAQLSAFYPIGADLLSLNNEDFSLLIDAANGLLRKSPLHIGASTSWRNQQTGSNGTIHVTKTFHRDGMLCHTLSYETIPAATPPANTTDETGARLRTTNGRSCRRKVGPSAICAAGRGGGMMVAEAQ